MELQARVDELSLVLTEVEGGIRYVTRHAEKGDTEHTLSVQQILTRRFLEDQILKSLVGSPVQEVPAPEPRLRIVEA